MFHPKFKEMECAYGFDDVAIVPGSVTINPDQADIHLTVENPVVFIASEELN